MGVCVGAHGNAMGEGVNIEELRSVKNRGVHLRVMELKSELWE